MNNGFVFGVDHVSFFICCSYKLCNHWASVSVWLLWLMNRQASCYFIYLFIFYCNVLFCSIYVNLNVWLYTWLVSFLSLEPKQKTAYLTINILIYVWIIYVTSDIHILSISIFDLHKETKTKVLYLAGH